MNVDQKTEEAVFKEAIKLESSAERAAFVRQACGSDTSLLSRIEILLQAHDEAGDFLETPPVDFNVVLDDAPLSEAPGTVIGRYKLLEKIGEGGMAVVYMAEQTEPIRRKVALKIIKLGMDTKQVIARFEAERQALAMMDHPNIAKVFDAGATETGRPYFVMELVQGVSITEYCDRNNLSTKDRLALFLQVCHAVQHAHQKGIIHRDIKPSNVMVTHHDGKPVPKVIDFGIAKATNQRLTEKTLFTRYAHIIGTPAYMSPEQAELSDLDIDTRTDIYSLGVLLYELLTGATPFSEEELRKAGYIEMQRVIREREPAKPSTKLTTLGETLTDVAKHRNCTPDLLRKAVRGDLDWIVMKSLEKDRARRYETANGLALDIQRHLEYEPVLARGPSTTYRLRKFLRRHRSQAVAGLAIVVIAAIVITILSLWNQDRAQLAEAEGFRHRGILSQVREQYARADRDIALETIKPILQSRHVGSEAQLLRAGILADNRRFDEAVGVLKNLLNDQPEVAGAAHSLLARILWESESLNADKLKEIEEHRQRAEALLPETAEAYFLRAMTAITVKEQLVSLDRALQLDPGHYESRRLRAYTYYASRKYEKMKDDAMVLMVLRPGDPLGHSLHAIAWRELGRHREAIADYDSAIALTAKDSAQYVDLLTQRCETLLRMGSYQQVIADAQEYLKLLPDKPVFQYDIFCALTALGEYDKAVALFCQIVSPGDAAHRQFRDWCAKYAFDILDAGRSWHPPGRKPVGAAFLPMVEAEETYHHLAAKAKHVISDGFSGHWSPDGKKLAFSLGFIGYSGVAVFDPATKETELLIVPGKDPVWSPDGKYIAFVRDCDVLRPDQLATAEGEDPNRPLKNEEVWTIKSDGTEPRRLARGGWPSWGRDPTTVYYHSRADKMLCSVSIEGADAQPKRIMPCSNSFPSISPDGKYVAYTTNTSLKVKDLTAQKPVVEWPAPVPVWGGAWSPTGKELCLGGDNNADVTTGLWIYRLDGSEPVTVLSGQIMMAAWSSDRTKLLITLGPPYFEIWAADLDPNVSITEALGPARTLEEHYREMVALHTRRIEADPLDADAYSSRAQYYDCLHDRVKARADMRRWSAAVSGRFPCDFRRVIDLPFDYQLVFSAERPVNEIPMLCVAFGQKGRGNMKLLEIPMFVASLFGFSLLAGLDAPAAQANFTFGQPEKVSGLRWNEWIDCFSYDGLEMYTGAPDPTDEQGLFWLWVRKRASIDEDWGPPEELGPLVHGGYHAEGACISSDGLAFYFCSTRPYGYGYTDIYVTTRATRTDPWGPAVNLGPTINSSGQDRMVWVSADNLELYFGSTAGGSYRSDGYGASDIYVARRATANDPWGTPVNLGPIVNTPYGECYVCLSPDGLLLFFSEYSTTTNIRPGGHGAPDIWMTGRASKNAPWQTPVNLESPINGPTNDFAPLISADGRTLYFQSIDREGGGDFQVPIIPIVDFNGDGKVDAADIAMLLADWGKSQSPCDIGPFAWGDGIVDSKDLGVLMEPLVTPGPKASDVRRDVVLSWASPSSVKYCDVYCGTSFEAVRDANRADPGNVLVSYAQTAATYDPEGLLGYSTTYYWRVDFVSAGLTVYKGPVLSFTTVAYSYPLKSVVATASSAKAGSGPEKTVDGSGLDKNNGHSTDIKEMWSSSGAPPQWIQFEFDKVYTLHQVQVWNHNSEYEGVLGFGARNVNIEYSTDGMTWTPLAGVPEFARAPGTEGYAANTTVDFAGVSAQFVKLTITKNWGPSTQTGLSEVRFFYIPTASTPSP